jgi:hypothetical protein
MESDQVFIKEKYILNCETTETPSLSGKGEEVGKINQTKDVRTLRNG